MNVQELIAQGIDILGSMVVCEHFKGTLMEFLDVNNIHDEDYHHTQALHLIAVLLAKGEARIDTGNGTYVVCRLVELSSTKDREEELDDLICFC